MSDINLWAILVAVITVFVASSIYYVIFNKVWTQVSPGASAKPHPSQALIQLARNLVLASVLAYLVRSLGITTLGEAAKLSVILWLGFPVVLLTGSVTYEKTPVKLALLHAGDALMALLLFTGILALWR